MARYKLTVRHGSRVRRESFDDLGGALLAMETHADQILADGPLEGVTMLRQFDPGDRVAARLELSSGGWLHRRDAGVDVMGDGSIVPFRGGIRRRELDPVPGESPFEAIRRELAG